MYGDFRGNLVGRVPSRGERDVFEQAVSLLPPALPLPGHQGRDKLGRIMWQLCKEFLFFLKQEKKWWLVPLIVILLLLALVLIFSGTSVLAPFMYPFI